MNPIYKLTPDSDHDKPQINDELLWSDFKNGNKKSFELLYKKFFFKLYNYGYQQIRDKELIQDCLHDLFLNIWKNKETTIVPQSVKNYLFIAFKRKMLDAIKYKSRFSNSEQSFELEENSFEHDLVLEQAEQEKMKKLNLAMKHLTPKQREAIFLRYFEEMEYNDIAQVLGYDTNSVYVLISRSIAVLRKYITQLIILLLSAELLFA
jgi:RNA polymerase sigma factor (sigma-70 family)